MDERLEQLLKDIRRVFHDAKILLFGSRARGDARQQSDYDLIIISRDFSRIPFVDRAGEVWLKTEAPIGADLLCYTPQEFKRVSKTSVVIRDALKHAIPI